MQLLCIEGWGCEIEGRQAFPPPLSFGLTRVQAPLGGLHVAGTTSVSVCKGLDADVTIRPL